MTDSSFGWSLWIRIAVVKFGETITAWTCSKAKSIRRKSTENIFLPYKLLDIKKGNTEDKESNSSKIQHRIEAHIDDDDLEITDDNNADQRYPVCVADKPSNFVNWWMPSSQLHLICQSLAPAPVSAMNIIDANIQQ